MGDLDFTFERQSVVGTMATVWSGPLQTMAQILATDLSRTRTTTQQQRLNNNDSTTTTQGQPLKTALTISRMIHFAEPPSRDL